MEVGCFAIRRYLNKYHGRPPPPPLKHARITRTPASQSRVWLPHLPYYWHMRDQGKVVWRRRRWGGPGWVGGWGEEMAWTEMMMVAMGQGAEAARAAWHLHLSGRLRLQGRQPPPQLLRLRRARVRERVR